MAKTKYDWRLVRAKTKDKTADDLTVQIKRDYHPHLRDLGIAVLFKPTGEPMVSVAGAWQNLLADVDAVLILPWESWQKWELKEREARIDDLLARLDTNEKTGHAVRHRPDVVGFLSVYTRRGAYNEGLEAVESRLKQYDLPGMGPNEPEAPAAEGPVEVVA